MPPRHPHRHISIRVPWHDAEWNGSVCKEPKANAACLILPRIRELRVDEKEGAVAGKFLKELSPKEWPACMSERGSFMAPFEFHRPIGHPYSKTSDLHKHILPTDFRHPSYSAAAIPFRWMNRQFAWDLSETYDLDVDPEREPTEPEWLKNNNWVQNHENQRELLKGFFSALILDKSLCFFYAKQTPLAEDERRVILAVGWLKYKGDLTEYNYSKKNGIRSYIWDRILQHSIRPNFKDGFILPYHEILKQAEKDPTINPADFVAFAPDDRWLEFSYACEHVTHDGAIAALLACKSAIEKCKRIVAFPAEGVLKWIDRRLTDLWKLRGPYPGLGSALTAFGIEHGNLLAYQVLSQIEENEDPWPLLNQIIKDPSSLPNDLASKITPTLRAKWQEIISRKPKRLSLLKLLSRLEISIDQATRYYVVEEREEAGIKCSDDDLLANPYLLYEQDRMFPDPLSIWTVDRGLFPVPVIREAHPLPAPSKVEDPTDPRRVRAFTVATLERATEEGHTLMPRAEVVRAIRGFEIQPECPVDGDLFDVIFEQLEPEVRACELRDCSPAYQLARLAEVRKLISSTVERRIAGKRLSVDVNWPQLLDERLGAVDPEDDEENLARMEKAAGLKELAESRFSVLIGRAGTGKTTLLSVLCNEPKIKKSGILTVAPTGKARVKLQQITGIVSQTLAQFLLPLDRYDESTGVYKLSDQNKVEVGKTLIVDEASMLTEEQLGALLDAVKAVDRVILVGDSRQLPPIGSGRPLVDIVSHLTPPNIEASFPRVGKSYVELIIQHRQSGEVREDQQLAEWFSGRTLEPGEDEIISKILTQNEVGKHLRFISWKDDDELHQLLLDVLSEELSLQGSNDILGFELSRGGKAIGGRIYFNVGVAELAESWQILSPVRGMPFGVKDINRTIQKSFRWKTLQWAKESNQPPWLRMTRITRARGPEEIVYGDKVINIENRKRSNVYPKENAVKYVANGEIGVVIGQVKGINDKWSGLPWLTKVEFSSQPGFRYDYKSSDFKEEGNPLLELAYAITVHKAQGSEFDLCLLVIPNPCRILSRELLYTAFTRQRQRLVVLYQGARSDLRRYTSDYFSETARRLTNLFLAPSPVQIDDRFLEEFLIHRSGKGEPMRSKSEVIIADALAESKIEYVYEQELVGSDGPPRYPDFTIEDAEQGITYFWEHCGLLETKQYRERWERKLQWYRDLEILSIEEGGGNRGTLIVTRDDPRGGINSQQIRSLIKKIWK